MLALLLVSWIPLVNALIKLLSAGLPAAMLLPKVAAIGAVAVVVLAAGIAALHVIERRR